MGRLRVAGPGRFYTATSCSRNALSSEVFLSVDSLRRPITSAHGTWNVPAGNCLGHVPGITTAPRGTVTAKGSSPSRSCGGFTSEWRGKNLRLTVESVAVGSIPSSSCDVRVVASSGTAPGTRVVFWGARVCTDGWHPWGSSLYVREDSTLELFSEPGHGGRIPVDRFLDRVRRAADGRRKAWSGFRELVSARVIESSWNKALRELSCRCQDLNDSRLEWKAVFQPSRSAVWSEISQGDTLLLPVTDPGSRTVTYAIDPTSFEVRGGYVPGLGVSFANRMAAFDA